MSTLVTSRRLLAAAVLIVPLLIGVNALFHPAVEISGEGLLHGAHENATAWYIVHMVAAIGAMLTIAAGVGLRTLVVDRGRRLANVALAATIVGAPLLVIGFVAEASVLRLAAGVDEAAGVAVATEFAGTPEFYVIPLGVLGVTLGNVLMAIGLLKARAVPRWAAGLFIAGWLASLATVPGAPVTPVIYAAVAVSAAVLAGRVARGRLAYAPTPDDTSRPQPVMA
ncbi:MAG TPA: hypothetical protein VFZ63_17000 [Jiangellaceae bacterium]